MSERCVEIPGTAFAVAGGPSWDEGPGARDPRGEVVRAVLALLHWRRPGASWELAGSVRLPVALVELVRQSAGPRWEPWRWCEPEPQPLPPRVAAALSAAQAVANRVVRVHELAAALPEHQRGCAACFAADQLSRFVRGAVDDPADEITPADLVVMGMQLENSAAAAPDGLCPRLAAAGQELMALGLDRLEAAAPAAVMAGARPRASGGTPGSTSLAVHGRSSTKLNRPSRAAPEPDSSISSSEWKSPSEALRDSPGK